jgi:hypothetical protein
VDELNNTTFTESFTARRSVLPEHDLQDLKNLTVSVVPRSVEIHAVTRQSHSFDIAVDVGIQQKVGKDTEADVLRLSGLVSEVVFYLARKSLDNATWARFVSIVNEPIYAPDHLSEQRLFTSVITITYKVID